MVSNIIGCISSGVVLYINILFLENRDDHQAPQDILQKNLKENKTIRFLSEATNLIQPKLVIGSSNIQSAPAYGVYISQLMQYPELVHISLIEGCC